MMSTKSCVSRCLVSMILLAAVAGPRAVAAAPTAQALQSSDVVAICGDSITEQKLYSVFMEEYLLMCQPASQVQAMQFGWSGETSWQFLVRMANDVLVFKPSVATTCYGMNDGGYAALTQDRAKQYREATEGIVKAFKQAGVRLVVVGSPGVVDTATFRRVGAAVYNETLGQLRDIAHEVATQQGATFADVHSPMLAAMEKAKAKYGTAYAVAGSDGVHPAANGQLIMAYAFLKALGCSGDIGTITLNAKTGKATATEGHKVLKSSATSVEILSSRYPFCFSGEPNSPNATAGIIEFFPFNEDLNRLCLVVQDGPSGQVKVTWGSHSKVFSSADLQKGINLAAEFLDNPFSESFAKVETQIKAQQNYETPAIKTLLHSLPQWDKSLPESKGTLDRLRKDLAAKDVTLRKAARAAVVSVRHTIKIEAAGGQ
jgi:lysophospholipase L1-like esterase